MSAYCEIKDYKILKKQLEQMKKAPETVIKRTVSDMRTRVPTWVAGEVAKQYGIKKAEINGNKVGKVRVKGNSVDTVQLEYSGRVLTPTHFGMNPTAPKAGGGGYTLKATITKGNRATLGKIKSSKKQKNRGANFRRANTRTSQKSPMMLMHTGAKSADKTQYIPFQRVGDRKKIYAIKTVSLPQMVSGEHASENITKAINEGLEKRLAQHMKLLEK